MNTLLHFDSRVFFYYSENQIIAQNRKKHF